MELIVQRSKPKKNRMEESREWLLKYILNVNEEGETDSGIDKFALLLKSDGRDEDGEGEEEGEREEKGKKLKMIGFVGTNRWCEQGLEVGYCLNRAYWGRGYITEGFRAFLEIFWELPGKPNPPCPSSCFLILFLISILMKRLIGRREEGD
jgi:RimJ/RimL family protein N-acetyltransferase